MPSRAALALLLLVLTMGGAEAHRLNVFASLLGETIEGRVYFTGGGVGGNLPVALIDMDGAVAAETVSSDAGTFVLPLPRRADFILRADARDGHVAEFPIRAAARAETPAPAAPAAAPPEDDLETLIARAVAPLAAQVDRLESDIRLRDLLGGVGYILGLFGLWALIRAGRRRGGPP